VDCLILDVVGASRGQKLQTLVDLHESSDYDTTELDEALVCALCGQEHDGPCPMDAGDVLVPEDDDEDAGPIVDPAGPPKLYAELELLADEDEWTWLQTPAGHPFVPVDQLFVFLWEAPGRHTARWSVGYVNAPDARRPRAEGYLGHGLVLSEAKALAERYASHEPGAGLAAKSAKWRRGRPSPDQRGIAERWGIDTTGMSRAECVDAIAQAQAAAVIDTL
jgi:hypothetical protein